MALDGCQQLIQHRLILPPFTQKNGVAAVFQAKNVGRAFQPAQRKKFGNGLVAQPLDIKRAATDKMPKPLGPLRRADEAAGAADIDLALFVDSFAAALGAMVGKGKGGCIRLLLDNFNDLGNHVSGALNHHPVTHPHIQPGNLVSIVQGHVKDTTTPPTLTGFSRPTGVSFFRFGPPECRWPPARFQPRSAGNLRAIAQRGALATNPSRR